MVFCPCSGFRARFKQSHRGARAVLLAQRQVSASAPSFGSRALLDPDASTATRSGVLVHAELKSWGKRGTLSDSAVWIPLRNLSHALPRREENGLWVSLWLSPGPTCPRRIFPCLLLLGARAAPGPASSRCLCPEAGGDVTAPSVLIRWLVLVPWCWFFGSFEK